MSNQLISIIVPVYNVEKYIVRCIESVEKQSYDLWELILIDDGSNDDSLNLCNQYAKKDGRIRVFSQNNNGVSSARNRGLEISKGEYVTFIDGDDYWQDSDFLLTVSQNFSYDVIYTPDIILQYPSGAQRKDIVSDQLKMTVVEENPALYIAKNVINHRWGCVCFVIKRALIESGAYRFDKSTKIGEDADWVFRTIKSAQSLIVINNPNYVYCVNRVGSAMTTKSAEAVLSLFHMTEKWKIIAQKEAGFEPIYRMFCNNAMDYFHTFGVYSKTDRERLIDGLYKCGAYEHSDSSVAIKIREAVKRKGLKRCIFFMGLKYKFRLIGSHAKNKFILKITY